MPALVLSSSTYTSPSTMPSPSSPPDLKLIGIIVGVVVGCFVAVFVFLVIVRFACEWMNARGVQREHDIEAGRKRALPSPAEGSIEVYQPPPPACQGTPTLPQPSTFPEAVPAQPNVPNIAQPTKAKDQVEESPVAIAELAVDDIAETSFVTSSIAESSVIEDSLDTTAITSCGEADLPVIETEDVVVISPEMFDFNGSSEADKTSDDISKVEEPSQSAALPGWVPVLSIIPDIYPNPLPGAPRIEQNPVFDDDDEEYDGCRMSLATSWPSPSRFIVHLPVSRTAKEAQPQPSSTFLPFRKGPRRMRPSSVMSIDSSPTKGKGRKVSLSGGIRPLKLVGERKALGDLSNNEGPGRTITGYIAKKMAAAAIPSPTKPLPVDPENVPALMNPALRSPDRYRAALKGFR